ncbi:MAG: ABC transporter ATP-binding protein [Oscillospiraceae bacterium]|nr:ABC transporter ATP-binding protein [Oscillospiraceae bacterium]
MVEIKNYTKIIKGNTVLKNINLTLEDGKVYGFSGINASGKTMLMRAICGLITPTEGEVIIDDQVLGKDISFPPSVGGLIESPLFIDSMTGYKNLELLSTIKNISGKEDIENALIEVGLDPRDKRKYRKFSLGMKQKLGIAAAIMEHPKLLILDEPLNALDVEAVQRVHNIVKRFKEGNALVILACHAKEELEAMCDEIIYIENGAIVDGKA